jgi:hypothetical protein
MRGGRGVAAAGRASRCEGEWCCRIDSSLVLAIRERFVGGWGGVALMLPPWGANEQRTRTRGCSMWSCILFRKEFYFYLLEKMSFFKDFSVL